MYDIYNIIILFIIYIIIYIANIFLVLRNYNSITFIEIKILYKSEERFYINPNLSKEVLFFLITLISYFLINFFITTIIYNNYHIYIYIFKKK